MFVNNFFGFGHITLIIPRNNVLTFTFTATDYDNFAFEYLLIDE